MEDSLVPSARDELGTPSWATKEDRRARREDGLDQRQGYGLVWTLIIHGLGPALVALGGLIWRLVG